MPLHFCQDFSRMLGPDSDGNEGTMDGKGPYLATDLLPASLLVIHDASRGRHHKHAELCSGARVNSTSVAFQIVTAHYVVRCDLRFHWRVTRGNAQPSIIVHRSLDQNTRMLNSLLTGQH